MSLSTQQLTEYGLRPAYPISECKDFGGGWVAKCRFRLTDHEIMVLDEHYYNRQVGVELDEEKFKRIIDNHTYEIEAIPTREGQIASWSWKRREYYFDLKSETETEINRSMIRHLTLRRNPLKGTQGFFVESGLELKSAVQILLLRHENTENADPYIFHWRVFMGDPDDLDEVYKWHVENLGNNYQNKDINPFYVYAVDVNPDGDPTYCSRGVADGEGFLGVICRFDNYTETTSWNKIKQITYKENEVRARKVVLQLGNEKMPWTVTGPRWQDIVIPCKFPPNPNLSPLHKKGVKKTFSRPTTDNIIGLRGTDRYDLEVFLPKIIKRGDVEYVFPDKTIAARLHKVNFYFCGCKDDEIECEDGEGNICCVDCCKIGSFVLEKFS